MNSSAPLLTQQRALRLLETVMAAAAGRLRDSYRQSSEILPSEECSGSTP